MINTSRWRKRLAVSAAILVVFLASAPGVRANERLSTVSDLTVFGLTANGRLVRFLAGAPQLTTVVGRIRGLTSPDTALIGIDFRVQDGLLYGVGNGGGVYTIALQSAKATFVNSLTVALEGTSFGVDFNPAADRLRIVSDTGQNLRHNVNAGGTTLVDATLTYTQPAIDPTMPAPALPPAALGVVAVAYTNNDLDADTATTLFVLDSTLDQIAIQSPANNGILVPTGKLGLDIDALAGFDIYSPLLDSSAISNRVFATLVVGGKPGFYQILPLTGTVEFVGNFDKRVIDIAIPLDQ